MDAIEAEILEEIQLVQTKLTQSRQRNAVQRNRGLLRRNRGATDSIFRDASKNSSAHPSSRSALRNKLRPSPSDPSNDRPTRGRIISVSFSLPTKEYRESARQQLFQSILPPKALFSVQDASDSTFVWVGAADTVGHTQPNNFEHVYGQGHRAAWRSVDAHEYGVNKLKRSICVPVMLPDEPEFLAKYESYCEGKLWPLLHNDYNAVGTFGSSDEYWSAYRFVNQRFAEAISEIYEDGDLIWVHDYHLMLLPSMLRESLWYAKIGFFLYTPFPSAEIFRILPRRTELLQGVIGADLIGFHSYDFAKQFVASCTRLLGIDGNPNSIDADPRVGRKCELGIYPSGIDVRALKNHLSSKLVKSRIAELRARFESRKIVVGVDRLDNCFAGISLKLLAFEQLLVRNPDLKGKVVLVEVAMLPKQGKKVSSYRAQQIQVNELVGRINSSFGTFASSPVHYINAELPPWEIHALMSVGHVYVMSAVRDGMALIPHEWTVCQHGGHKGPIVLSEFAGAAHSFATALHVNPWDVDDMAAKIKVALDMGAAARNTRNEAAYRLVTSHTAALWGFNFLEDLEQSDGAQLKSGSSGTPVLDISSVRVGYLGSSTQPSPVTSSNRLSSMNTAFSQTGRSPRIHPDMFSALRTSSGSSQWLATSPELRGGKLNEFLNGDGMLKGTIVSPTGDRSDTLWLSPDAMRQVKRKKRSVLFILDLDGTLVPFQAIAKLGAPTQNVLDILQALKDASPYSFILVLSSRDRDTVMKWLGDMDIFLAAEDGAYFQASGTAWTALFRDTSGPNFLQHHASSGQFSSASFGSNGHQSSASAGSGGDTESEYEMAENGENAEPKEGRQIGAETFNIRQNFSADEERVEKTALSSKGSKIRGSTQSITSLSNDAGITSESAVLDWKSQILPVMQHFAERTPGVVIEEGDASLTWHYADADTDFGRWQARDLYKHLESFLLQRQSIDLVSEEGRRRWIKARPRGVDKTLAVVKTLEHIRDTFQIKLEGREASTEDEAAPSIDFVLCIGDDRADEGMFEFFQDQNRLDKLGVHCAPKRIFTCRVGSSTTAASWFLESSQRVIEVLESLAQCKLPGY